IAPGQRIDRSQLIDRLTLAGFVRASTVMEPGEFAVRGSLVDLYPPGRQSPVRLDFFDDTLESIKSFDPETQRTQKIVQRLMLTPMSEIAFGNAATSRFRQSYVSLFGPAHADDQLYEAVSAGQRFPGQEHWLPLFHDRLETIFDYLPDSPLSLDHMTDQSLADRQLLYVEHYQSRVEALEVATFGAPPYEPVTPGQMYIPDAEWKKVLGEARVSLVSAFESGDVGGTIRSVN